LLGAEALNVSAMTHSGLTHVPITIDQASWLIQRCAVNQEQFNSQIT